MNKGIVFKFLIYAVCIFFIFIVNLIYFKSGNKIIDKVFKSRIANKAATNTTSSNNTTTNIIDATKVTNQQTENTNVEYVAIVNLENPSTLVLKSTENSEILSEQQKVDLVSKATTEMTGIQVLSEDENVAEIDLIELKKRKNKKSN